jgi:hypothetical protein
MRPLLLTPAVAVLLLATACESNLHKVERLRSAVEVASKNDSLAQLVFDWADTSTNIDTLVRAAALSSYPERPLLETMDRVIKKLDPPFPEDSIRKSWMGAPPESLRVFEARVRQRVTDMRHMAHARLDLAQRAYNKFMSGQ